MKVRHDKRIYRLLLMGMLFGCVAYLAVKCIFVSARIMGDSMEPTLHAGEYTAGIRSWWMGEPGRGDIISFHPPGNNNELYVKRIIGLPGEKVEIRNGRIYIDDSEDPLAEPYLGDGWTVDTGPYRFEVPEGKYLVLGDNRNMSYDSRDWDDPYVDHGDIRSRTCIAYRTVTHIRYLYGCK